MAVRKNKISKKSLKFISWENYLKRNYSTKKSKKGFNKRVDRLNLGYEIFLARKRKKLTQKQLAKKIKTSQSVIARIETGGQNVTIDTLKRIGDVLDHKVALLPKKRK